MSGRMYWLSVIAVIAVSSAFWWAALSWLGVTEPMPLVAFLDAVALTGYLVFLRWWLKALNPVHSPTESPSAVTH